MAGNRYTCPYCQARLKGRYWDKVAHIRDEHPEMRNRTGQEHAQHAHSVSRGRIEQLVALYGRRCMACGMTEAQARAAGRGGLTTDHVIPVSRHGADDITNWQLLCGSCNGIKGDAIIDYRPVAIVAGLLAAAAEAEADALVVPNVIVIVTDPGTCVMRRIGRMGWCDVHQQPMGHAIREALAARRAIVAARDRQAERSRGRRIGDLKLIGSRWRISA